jgi:hypothetical protein
MRYWGRIYALHGRRIPGEPGKRAWKLWVGRKTKYVAERPNGRGGMSEVEIEREEWTTCDVAPSDMRAAEIPEHVAESVRQTIQEWHRFQQMTPVQLTDAERAAARHALGGPAEALQAAPNLAAQEG